MVTGRVKHTQRLWHTKLRDNPSRTFWLGYDTLGQVGQVGRSVVNKTDLHFGELIGGTSVRYMKSSLLKKKEKQLETNNSTRNKMISKMKCCGAITDQYTC